MSKKPMNVVYLRRAKVPQERVDKIQELLLQGYTQKQIGNILNKSQGAIAHCIRQYGLKSLSRGDRAKLNSPSKLNDAKKLLKEGKSQLEVAKILGVTQGTISGWVKKYNIEVTPHVYKRGINSTETSADISLIKQYLAEKKNLKEIGDLIGVSGQTVDRWIKKYGLDDSHIRRWKR